MGRPLLRRHGPALRLRRLRQGGRSRALTLTVRFCEQTPSYLETAFSESAVIREGDLTTGEVAEFRFTLPPQAPPSVRGRYGALFWELEALSDEPGLDTRVSRALDVVAR